MFFIFFIDADLKQFKLNFNSVLLSERVNRIDIVGDKIPFISQL